MKEAGGLHFSQLNRLEVDVKVHQRRVTVELTDFTLADPELLPERLRGGGHFTDCIDYWAVDFDYKGDTFHNMWQSFRTRSRELDTRAAHQYQRPGAYRILIEATDVFGNDTTSLLSTEIP